MFVFNNLKNNNRLHSGALTAAHTHPEWIRMDVGAVTIMFNLRLKFLSFLNLTQG